MARSRRLLCCAAAVALVSCAVLPEELVGSVFPSKVELVFHPPSDLPAPERARVTSNEDRQIALAWNPVLVGDVAGYVILRALSPQDSSPVFTISVKAPSASSEACTLRET